MAPQIGPGPQNVINKQMGEYDIFVGIMWSRFGTPTDVASSGTEEEFRIAIKSWKDQRKPWIAFYFCNRPVNLRNEDQIQQKGKVVTFRSELEQLGLVRDFRGPSHLEHLAYDDLVRITALPEFLELLNR